LAEPLKTTRWSWIAVCIGFVVLAMASHKLVEPVDILLAKANAPLAVDVAIDLAMVCLAALGCALVFMAWFGADPYLRRRLSFSLILCFALWTIFSFMQIGAVWNWAPIVWGLAPYTAAELALGATLVWGAVFASAKIIDLLPRRPTAAGVS
jgi:hypothetical protein